MRTTKPINRRTFLVWFTGGAVSLATFRAEPVERWRKTPVQQSSVAGFQFHYGERLWPQLRAGDRLTLVREPDNPYDKRAVRVEWGGWKLGYVPRNENTAVAQMLDRGQRLDAEIARLGAGPSPWNRIEMEIWLVD